jgi:hypothetical protein
MLVSLLLPTHETVQVSSRRGGWIPPDPGAGPDVALQEHKEVEMPLIHDEATAAPLVDPVRRSLLRRCGGG